MELDFDYKPNAFIKAGFYGLEKRGKTHGMCSLALMAYKHLGMKGRIAAIDNENFLPDWYDRIVKVTGSAPVPCNTSNPSEALAFAKACEAHDDVCFLLIDSATEILSGPRDVWVEKNDKGIPLNLYKHVDRPFSRFAMWCKWAKIHWAATMREADDSTEIDGVEVKIGKKAKAGELAYAARLSTHCFLRKRRGKAPDHCYTVTDCLDLQVDDREYVNAGPEIWAPYLNRYKAT